MTDQLNREVLPGTEELKEPIEKGDSGTLEPNLKYLPFPHAASVGRPMWRVRFELPDQPEQSFGLDINDEIVFGRATQSGNTIDLGPYGALEHGVSRRHAMIQPTSSALYIVDLGSANGTLRNGQSIGVNTPYSLVNGDILSLGRLHMFVHIVDRPRGVSDSTIIKADLADALTHVAKAITSQLELTQVLKYMSNTAMNLTESAETSIWLVDESSGTLFLEAQRGIEDDTVRLLRIPLSDDTMVGKVFQTGEIIRASRTPGETKELETVTGEDAEAVIYVPLKLGNTTFGVLSATHRATGKEYTDRDQRLLAAIADFASIAIANARLFKQLERERATIRSTIDALPQPLIILDDTSAVLVSNQAAKQILDKYPTELTEGLRARIGRTDEMTIGEKTYLTTTEHAPTVGTIVVMQDITYEQLLERDRAEMIHTMMHDLKSPISAVKGWATLLNRVNPLNDKGKEYVQQINTTLKQMDEMISHVVNAVRMTDVATLDLAPCQLDEVARHVIRDLEGAALVKSVSLTFECEGEAFSIMADSARIYHMTLNLVDNAIKYTSPDTTISIVVAFRDNEVHLNVLDEGPGINSEEADRIYDKFYRGVRHRDDRSGVGLGLSVVQAVATAHGGTATVANRDPRGANFAVTLPRVPPGHEAAEAES
nr:FHA domain-containing protein [Anaerolineae bacterium]